MSFAAGDIAGPGLQSTPKIPPSFDGRSSWFSYEEALDDWVDITTLDAEKQGPSLKNRLVGDAAVYKPLLDRDLLRDPNNGVRYFKDTVRPHFVKGNQSVFLWRFSSSFDFTEANRISSDGSADSLSSASVSKTRGWIFLHLPTTKTQRSKTTLWRSTTTEWLEMSRPWTHRLLIHNGQTAEGGDMYNSFPSVTTFSP